MQNTFRRTINLPRAACSFDEESFKKHRSLIRTLTKTKDILAISKPQFIRLVVGEAFTFNSSIIFITENIRPKNGPPWNKMTSETGTCDWSMLTEKVPKIFSKKWWFVFQIYFHPMVIFICKKSPPKKEHIQVLEWTLMFSGFCDFSPYGSPKIYGGKPRWNHPCKKLFYTKTRQKCWDLEWYTCVPGPQLGGWIIPGRVHGDVVNNQWWSG